MMAENWREIITQGTSAELLALLPELERGGTEGVAAALLPLMDHADFAVRLRCFITLGRLNDARIAPQLAAYLGEPRPTVWRLLTLDALSRLPADGQSALLGPLLTDPDMIFVRGLLSVLGALGAEALPYLTRFVSTDRCRWFRDELVAEALWQAADNEPTLLAEWAARDPGFARWYSYRIPWDGQVRFGIYPYADYLWHQAEVAGLTQREFKRLFWWQRDKKSGGHE